MLATIFIPLFIYNYPIKKISLQERLNLIGRFFSKNVIVYAFVQMKANSKSGLSLQPTKSCQNGRIDITCQNETQWKICPYFDTTEFSWLEPYSNHSFVLTFGSFL